MKTDLILKFIDRIIIISLLVILLMALKNPNSIDSEQQSNNNLGRYTAVPVGTNGTELFVMRFDTQTGHAIGVSWINANNAGIGER
jgi:hypothetical protein